MDLIPPVILPARDNEYSSSEHDDFDFLWRTVEALRRSEQAAPWLGDETLHWISRGWGGALPQYLASTEVEYFDLGATGLDKGRDFIELLRANDDREPQSDSDARVLALPSAQDTEHLAAVVLYERRTRRSFRRSPCALGTVSSVLWDGFSGVRQARARLRGNGRDNFRWSFGSCFRPWLVTLNVESLARRTWLYEADEHGLRVDGGGDVTARELSGLLFGQTAPLTAAFAVVLVCDLDWYSWRYRHERALRNVFIEAGRIAQFLILAGESRGLSCLPTPAFRDDDLLQWLGIRDRDRYWPVYALTFGWRREDTETSAEARRG